MIFSLLSHALDYKKFGFNSVSSAPSTIIAEPPIGNGKTYTIYLPKKTLILSFGKETYDGLYGNYYDASLGFFSSEEHVPTLPRSFIIPYKDEIYSGNGKQWKTEVISGAAGDLSYDYKMNLIEEETVVAGITPKEKRTLLINDIESDDPAKRTQARMDILSKLNEFTPDERMSLLGAIARGKNK